MLREFIKESKNYWSEDKIERGYYLDVMHERRWNVGQVVAVSKYGIKISS